MPKFIKIIQKITDKFRKNNHSRQAKNLTSNYTEQVNYYKQKINSLEHENNLLKA